MIELGIGVLGTIAQTKYCKLLKIIIRKELMRSKVASKKATKTKRTNDETRIHLFVNVDVDPIKRLGYAIWALVAYDVFFTLIVLGVLKVNGII